MKNKFIALLTTLMMVIAFMPGLSDDVYAAKKKTKTTSMNIYCIYMKRASGSAVSSDRYGDAVLVKSGGKYLLMDTGDTHPIKNDYDHYYPSTIVKTLKSIGVKELDVYISHLHEDHVAALKEVCDNFKVNKVYMPDKELAKDYVTPNKEKTIESLHEAKEKIIAEEGAKLIHLSPSFREHADPNAISSFTLGTSTVKVIGPVGNYTMEQFEPQDGQCGTMQGHYMNNYSLVTMITCGKTKYLSCGDIEKQEEEALVKKYGSSLKADIMKIDHHGLQTSSTDSFVKKVAPKWSFAENHGYSGGTGKSSHQKHGLAYLIADSKANLIITVKNNKVRLYKDKNNNGKYDDAPFKGWVKCGSNYQYYDSNGYVKSGWLGYDGKKYYMSSTSGLRLTGTHTISKTTCKFDSTGKLTSPITPPKVKLLDPVKGSRTITIKWSASNKATGYELYRYNAKKKTYVKIGSTKKSLQYTNKKLARGTTYKYKVRAIRSVAGTTLYGEFSDVISVKAK